MIAVTLDSTVNVIDATVNATISGTTNKTGCTLNIVRSEINAPNGIKGFEGSIYIEDYEVDSPEEAVIAESIFESDGVTVAESVIIGGAHVHADRLPKVEGIEPDCTHAGQIEHYTCTCGKIFKDEAAEEECTLEETVLPALGHDRVYVGPSDPTCETDGYDRTCRVCTRCGGVTTIPPWRSGVDPGLLADDLSRNRPCVSCSHLHMERRLFKGHR